MVRTSSSLRCLILVVLLLVERSNGFVGSGLQTKLVHKKCVSPHLFKAPKQKKLEQASPAEIGLRNDPTALRSTMLDGIPLTIAKSLFRYSGTVPVSQALALNVFLFVGLRTKLFKMLTKEGYFHALFLAVGLWSSLGWRGWTTCVLYLFLGSFVTKVKMQEKEKLGIAEGRGGRRGPENVW